jgi:hypothetical protein
MNVTIQKLNGLWHLIVGSCQIRTPFLETQDRALVKCAAPALGAGSRSTASRDDRLRCRCPMPS